jgi:hypothetical protein
MNQRGLSRVPTGELERLLRAMHRDLLPSPISRADLISVGFGNLEEHLGLLIGLERVAAQRLIVAVMAERRPRPTR